MTESVWWWRERAGDVACGFTRRESGVSEGDWTGLNLGGHVGDDAEAVARNRQRVLDSLVTDAQMPRVPAPVFMDQVHGAQVRILTEPGELSRPVPPTDGGVTTLTAVARFVLVADCVPILFWDNEAGIIGAAHAGRPGMLAGVVSRTITAMQGLGARDIVAAVGPSVCSRCYEVPTEMRAAAGAVEPVSAAVTWSGTPAIDVGAGVVEQLRRGGVSATWVPGCTREEAGLYSYRRDGRTGRFAGVITRSGSGTERAS